MLAHARRRVGRREVDGDEGRAAADPLGERPQPVLAPRDEHEPQVRARAPSRSAVASPIPLEAPVTTATRVTAPPSRGRERREVVLEAGRGLHPVQPSADRPVLARVGARLVRAVHVGVEGDVGHRVVLPAHERAVVGQPAGERGERAVPARQQRLHQLRVLLGAAREDEEAGDRDVRARSGSARRTSTGAPPRAPAGRPAAAACPLRGRAGSRPTRGPSRPSRARARARGRPGCAPCAPACASRA